MYKFTIFDLDDTLYARGNGLMSEVGRRIQTWLCENMELAWDDAVILRRKYYRQYGTTLGGLIAEHDVDAQDYLVYVHDIPLEEYIGPNPALDAMLASIPLRHAIYTNATAEYARRVLRVLGVSDHFEDVIGIDDVDLICFLLSFLFITFIFDVHLYAFYYTFLSTEQFHLTLAIRAR